MIYLGVAFRCLHGVSHTDFGGSLQAQGALRRGRHLVSRHSHGR
jgi:hypothetical protein